MVFGAFDNQYFIYGSMFDYCLPVLCGRTKQCHAGKWSNKRYQRHDVGILYVVGWYYRSCDQKFQITDLTMIPAGFYWFGTLLTFGTGSTYGDLPVWGGFSFVFGLVFVIVGLKMKKA